MSCGGDDQCLHPWNTFVWASCGFQPSPVQLMHGVMTPDHVRWEDQVAPLVGQWSLVESLNLLTHCCLPLQPVPITREALLSFPFLFLFTSKSRWHHEGNELLCKDSLGRLQWAEKEPVPQSLSQTLREPLLQEILLGRERARN